MMRPSKEIREFRQFTKEFSGWIRELDAMMHGPTMPAPPAPVATPMLPEQYSYIVCKVCKAPAIILRDRSNPAGVAIACMLCRDIAPLPEGLKNFMLE